MVYNIGKYDQEKILDVMNSSEQDLNSTRVIKQNIQYITSHAIIQINRTIIVRYIVMGFAR